MATNDPIPMLAVDVRGTGPRAMLLHGIAGSARYWNPVVDGLGKGVQTSAVDLLGFGQSPKPPDSNYDVDAHLAAILQIAPPKAVVVGHSTGAILALALARRHPDRVDGLVLTGLPMYPTHESAIESISNLSTMTRWAVEGDRRARWLCTAMCRLRPVAIAAAPLVAKDLPAAVARDAARHTWPSYDGTLRRLVLAHDVAADLSEVTCPVHVIQGDHDPVAPPDLVREALGTQVAGTGRDRTILEVVEGDHHIVHRRPEVIIDAIRSMIASTG